MYRDDYDMSHLRELDRSMRPSLLVIMGLSLIDLYKHLLRTAKKTVCATRDCSRQLVRNLVELNASDTSAVIAITGCGIALFVAIAA